MVASSPRGSGGTARGCVLTSSWPAMAIVSPASGRPPGAPGGSRFRLTRGTLPASARRAPPASAEPRSHSSDRGATEPASRPAAARVPRPDGRGRLGSHSDHRDADSHSQGSHSSDRSRKTARLSPGGPDAGGAAVGEAPGRPVCRHQLQTAARPRSPICEASPAPGCGTGRSPGGDADSCHQDAPQRDHGGKDGSGVPCGRIGLPA